MNIKSSAMLVGFCLAYIMTIDAQSKEEKHFSTLTGDSIRYWEPHYTFTHKVSGMGWQFSADSTFQEFRYNRDTGEKRKSCFLSNVYSERHSFIVVGDTLKIIYAYYEDEHFKRFEGYENYCHNGAYYLGFKFLIQTLNQDSLITTEINKGSNGSPYTYLDTMLHLNQDNPNPIFKDVGTVGVTILNDSISASD